jgi:hypothetical protein
MLRVDEAGLSVQAFSRTSPERAARHNLSSPLVKDGIADRTGAAAPQELSNVSGVPVARRLLETPWTGNRARVEAHSVLCHRAPNHEQNAHCANSQKDSCCQGHRNSPRLDMASESLPRSRRTHVPFPCGNPVGVYR